MGAIDLLVAAEQFHDPNYYALIRLVFIVVSALTLVLAGRLLWRFAIARSRGVEAGPRRARPAPRSRRLR